MGRFFLIGSPCFLDKELSIGDSISVILGTDEDSSNIVPSKMKLDIVYEDDYLLILNKPAGFPA